MLHGLVWWHSETQPVAAVLLRLDGLPRDQGFRGFDDLVDASGGVAVGHLKTR
jgi:hypothetical protein